MYWSRRLDQVNASTGDARYTLLNAIRGLRECKALHAKARVGAAAVFVVLGSATIAGMLIYVIGGFDNPMSDPLSVSFNCPNCGARYEVVRIEEPPRPTHREVTCLSCGGPLHGREGKFVLKYFLTDRAKRRAYRAAVAQSSQKGRTP